MRYNPLNAQGRQYWLARLVVLFVLGACAHAGSPPVETVVQPKIENSISVPVIDTTHLIEAPTDYSRYTIVACERTMLHARARALRQDEQDTGRYAPEQDTMPTAAVIAARQCAERFTVENVVPTQLLYLIRLSLAIGNDAQATAAIQRQLALASDSVKKGAVLLEVIRAYLDAKPMRLVAAEILMQYLDTFGFVARNERLQAHHLLMYRYVPLFKTDAIEREANTIIEISRTLTKEELDTWGTHLAAAYIQRASVAAFRGTFSASKAVLQEGIAAVGHIRGGQTQRTIQDMLQTVTMQEKIYDHPAQLLTGHYWYNTGDRTSRPTPGKVSLMIVSHPICAEFCYGTHAVIKRLHREYAQAGFEITIVVPTAGFSNNSGVQTPAEEIDAIRKYFLEDRNLPVALVVQETPFTTHPDGRRINGHIQFGELYPGIFAVLVDRTGIVRWLGPIVNIGTEATIRAYVAKLLAG